MSNKLLEQVPQVHRQILQQLYILLRNGRRRQVSPAAPAYCPVCVDKLVANVDGDRGQPDQPRDRGSHQDVLYGSVRELGQGCHESVLQGQHGSAQSRVSG